MISQKNFDFNDLNAETFLKIFPFCIAFNKKLQIKYIGENIKNSFDFDLKNRNLFEIFNIVRPKIDFDWNMVNKKGLVNLVICRSRDHFSISNKLFL